MTEHMTTHEWDRIFPDWPKSSTKGKSIGTIANTRYAGVITAVFLDERWPGITEPDDDLAGTIVFRAGRWCVSNTSLICLGSDYEIDADLLDELDWFSHLLEKVWLYDPSDFLDALEAARKHFLPQEHVEQRQAAINTQIQTAIERHQFPFYPSRVAGHVYLASHMDTKERASFTTFLASQGYMASHE